MLICSYCNRPIMNDGFESKGDKCYHQSCYDRNELEKFICKKFNYTQIPPKVESQINKYTNFYGYTYSGILGSLVYWYEVLLSPTANANGGIGIVPYIYDEAKEYYKNINEAQNNMLNSDYQKIIKSIEIHSPVRNTKKLKMIDLDFLEKEQHNE